MDFIKHHHSLTKFLIVGGCSFLVDYSVLLIGYHFMHLSLVVATSIGFLLGLIINFTFNKLWVFEASGGLKKTTVQAFLYGILVLINLLITNIVVVSLSALHVKLELSKPIATGLIMVLNFMAYKWVIFKNQAMPEDGIEPY